MNRRTSMVLIFWGFLAACCPLVYSQQRTVSNDRQIAEDALRDKAFALLESVADQVGSLQSTENRARIGSNLVDSLWPHDEKRARTLLVAVENDIKAALQNGVIENRRDEQTLKVFLQLRLETIERVAKHDAELALAFLKSTNVISGKGLPYGAESDPSIELRLAKQIAADNPDMALKIGRESLEGEFRRDLILLLHKLSRKHSDKASMLFSDIVSKLRQTNLVQNRTATYFARSLAASLTPPLADQSTYREFMGLLITSAINGGCTEKNPTNREFCRIVVSLLPQMEKTDPTRAAQLKLWASPGEFWDYGQMYAEVNEAFTTSSVEEMLDLAKKYPQMRREIYSRAVSNALSSGDIENARKIASNYEGDPEGQASLMAQINQQQKWANLSEEKLTEVPRMLNTLPNAQARLSYLVQIANQVGPNNPKTAILLLDQANGISEMMNPGYLQSQAQLAMAVLYCLFDSDRGFTLMESLVPKLNELIAAAAKLDGFDTRYLREGEWNMSAEGNLGRTLTGLSRSAGAFAWRDFDRAVRLAAEFERPEIRLMAQLKLGQGILAGKSKSLSFIPPPS